MDGRKRPRHGGSKADIHQVADEFAMRRP